MKNKLTTAFSFVLLLLTMTASDCGSTDRPIKDLPTLDGSDAKKPLISLKGDSCISHCCDTVRYCSISEEELRNNMENYRDKNWRNTSPHFEDVSDAEYHSGEKYVLTSDAPPKGAMLFDSRFVDVSLAQLKNYICAIETYDPCGPKFSVDVLRFYFIRYDEIEAEYDIPPNYEDKTSFAIVPVDTKKTGLGGVVSTVVECYNAPPAMIFIPEPGCPSGVTSRAANHSHLCPPLTGCSIAGTKVEEVDTP